MQLGIKTKSLFPKQTRRHCKETKNVISGNIVFSFKKCMYQIMLKCMICVYGPLASWNHNQAGQPFFKSTGDHKSITYLLRSKFIRDNSNMCSFLCKQGCLHHCSSEASTISSTDWNTPVLYSPAPGHQRCQAMRNLPGHSELL